MVPLISCPPLLGWSFISLWKTYPSKNESISSVLLFNFTVLPFHWLSDCKSHPFYASVLVFSFIFAIFDCGFIYSIQQFFPGFPNMLDHTTWSDNLIFVQRSPPQDSRCYQLAPSYLRGSNQMVPPHASVAQSRSHLCICFQVLGFDFLSV